MTYLKLDDKGEANLKAFREFARIKGEALEPCYVLQRRLRARIVGEAFWRSLAHIQVQLILAITIHLMHNTSQKMLMY